MPNSRQLEDGKPTDPKWYWMAGLPMVSEIKLIKGDNIMKKSALRTLLAAAMIVVPFSAFGLEAMNDQAMNDVTGQAGISIAVDNVQLYQSIGKLSYTDTDGITVLGAGGTPVTIAGGSLSISNLVQMTKINAIVDDTDRGGQLANAYGTILGNGFYTPVTDANAGATHHAQALSIDVVAALPMLSAGMTNNFGTAINVAGVLIGLPTVEIVQSISPFDIVVEAAGAANSGASFGQLAIENQVTAILSGTLEIAPH
jgi:hypothetical protein